MALVRPLRGFVPVIGENTFLADTAAIIGDVTVGRDCSIWFGAVLRGDVNKITVGDRVNIQDGVVVHTLYQRSVTEIGDDVSIGHNANIHGARIESRCLIGMGATVLDHAVVGTGSIVAANSLVLSRNFQFNPSTMQRQPAGPMRQIMNPAFIVGVWDGTIDICLPYIKGYVPPYYVTVINYTVPDVQGYTTEQTHEGWMVTFSTSLFSASTYTFTFEIFSRTGGANLTITNPWYSPVQYSGSISQLY